MWKAGLFCLNVLAYCTQLHASKQEPCHCYIVLWKSSRHYWNILPHSAKPLQLAIYSQTCLDNSSVQKQRSSGLFLKFWLFQWFLVITQSNNASQSLHTCVVPKPGLPRPSITCLCLGSAPSIAGRHRKDPITKVRTIGIGIKQATRPVKHLIMEQRVKKRLWES